MEQEDQFDFTIREKLGDFSIPPSDKVWEGVQGHLIKRRKRRFFWIFPALLMAGIVFWHYTDSQYSGTPDPLSDRPAFNRTTAKDINLKNQKQEGNKRGMPSSNAAEAVEIPTNDHKSAERDGNHVTLVFGKVSKNISRQDFHESSKVQHGGNVEKTVQERGVPHANIGGSMKDENFIMGLKEEGSSGSNMGHKFLSEQVAPMVVLPLMGIGATESRGSGSGMAYVPEMPAHYMLPYSWSLDLVLVSGVYLPSYGNRGVVNQAFSEGRDSASLASTFYDAGLRIQRSNRNGSFFSAGFLFGKRSDRFGFVYSFEVPQMVIDSSKFITIIDPVLPPQIIRDYDTNTVILRQSRKLQHEVSLQYFRVPVRFGYRFMHERMIFSISGGGDLGWITARGTIIDPQVMESFDSKEASIYRSSGLFDAVVSIGWEWKLSGKISFLAEPFFSKAITNIYRRDDFGSSRPFQVALLTGIRFKP